MWLFFIKPKRRRAYDPYVFNFLYKSRTPFLYIKYLCTAMFFLCIPFLYIAYPETINPFIWVNIAGLIASVFCKLLDPTYKYW